MDNGGFNGAVKVGVAACAYIQHIIQRKLDYPEYADIRKVGTMKNPDDRILNQYFSIAKIVCFYENKKEIDVFFI